MKNKFVTYAIALKLKELGFDDPCLAVYQGEKFKFNFELLDYGWTKEELSENKLTNTLYADENGFVTAPLWQDAIDYIREIKGIHIDLDFSLGWGYGFIPVGTELEYDWNHFEDGHNWSYHEAREAAILKAGELKSSEDL